MQKKWRCRERSILENPFHCPATVISSSSGRVRTIAPDGIISEEKKMFIQTLSIHSLPFYLYRLGPNNLRFLIRQLDPDYCHSLLNFSPTASPPTPSFNAQVQSALRSKCTVPFNITSTTSRQSWKSLFTIVFSSHAQHVFLRQYFQ